MRWRFEVFATRQDRLLSRILQVLEVQRVSIHSFDADLNEAEARMTFLVSSHQDKAYRIRSLLYRVEGVDQVSVSSADGGSRQDPSDTGTVNPCN